jgi:hypothetical protein
MQSCINNSHMALHGCNLQQVFVMSAIRGSRQYLSSVPSLVCLSSLFHRHLLQTLSTHSAAG